MMFHVIIQLIDVCRPNRFEKTAKSCAWRWHDEQTIHFLTKFDPSTSAVFRNSNRPGELLYTF